MALKTLLTAAVADISGTNFDVRHLQLSMWLAGAGSALIAASEGLSRFQ